MEYSRTDLTREALLHMRLKVDRSLDSGVRNIPVHCPFHSDRKASMFVRMDIGVFNCFQCHRSGSIESLFKEVTGASLYDTLGIRFDEFSSYARQPPVEEDLDKINREISIQIQGDVESCRSPMVLAYLRRRGITFKVAEELKIKFAENVRINGTLFRNRLLIPVQEGGKLISIEGRDLTGTATPKVLYPKDSTVNTLFDLDKLDVEKPLYVVEGLADLMVLRAYPEFKNSTSVFGAAITARQLHLLNRFVKVITLPNNDEAGTQSTARLKEGLRSRLWMLRVPKEYNGVPVKDVGDLITKARTTVAELLAKKWLSHLREA